LQISRRLLQNCSMIPTAFWNVFKHEVSLPYVQDFSVKKIPTRSKAIPMNAKELELCKNEIDDLLKKGTIRESSSPWACFAFYVNKHSEIVRGVPRLVVNYKPLNKVLEYDSYPLPKSSVILAQSAESKVFSKFDLKSGFWQIGIKDEDKYKTAFTVPHGHLYLQFRKLESIIFHVTFFPTLSCTCDADLPPTRNDYLQCYFPSIYTAIVFLSYFLEHFGGCFSCQSPDGLFFHAQEKRNPSTGSLNELEGKAQSRQDAAVKSGRELFHVLSQRVSMKISNISETLLQPILYF
jgi:hypothetical protein